MEFGRRKEGGKVVANYDTVLNIAVSKFEGGSTFNMKHACVLKRLNSVIKIYKYIS